MTKWIAITFVAAAALAWLLFRLAALVAGIMGLVVPARRDEDLDPTDPAGRTLGLLLITLALLALGAVVAVIWWAG